MRTPRVAAGGPPGRPGAGWEPIAAPDYDVIVVGARVAGASTAMLLARQGHRVLMVERAGMPSDVVSTHAILRSGVLQLTRWGLLDRVIAAGTPPVRDVILGFGGDRIPFEVRPEFGVDALYAPRRHLLDSILVEAAQEAGVEFADRTRVVDLARGPIGQVTGVVLKGQGNRLIRTAQMVVGADGVWSRIAGLVGANAYEGHPATNAVTYAYFREVEMSGFWFQFTPGVNAGLIPTNDGLCCVFVGRSNDRGADFRASDDEFNHLLRSAAPDLAEMVSEGSRASGFRGTNGLPGFIRQPWGPGWALVGDAGYTKDPISAHGISDGLRDAELCARAVDRAIRHPDGWVEAMTGYQSLRDRLSLRMFQEAQALARFEWDAAEASSRMRVISESVRAECEALEGLGEWSSAMSLSSV